MSFGKVPKNFTIATSKKPNDKNPAEYITPAKRDDSRTIGKRRDKRHGSGHHMRVKVVVGKPETRSFDTYSVNAMWYIGGLLVLSHSI